jgi:membrane protein
MKTDRTARHTLLDEAQDSLEPRDAPPPDDQTRPTKPTWKYVLGKTVREFSADQCTDLAAALTYYAVLALFPGLLALVSLLGIVGQQGNTQALLDVLSDAGAGAAADTIAGPLQELTQSSAAGFGLVIGIVGALWSASGYVGAFGRAMNRIYTVTEGRPFWKLRPLMMIITLGAVILAGLVTIGLVVSGPVARALGDAIGLGDATVTVWSVLKWPVLLLLAALAIALLYYATPNVKQPKFRWISVGAGVAIVTWVAASALFGLYISQFSNYNKTYGSLAGVIIFLLWLWITNLALLFGAELDAEIERGRQLQAGIAAEQDIQLPLRDTTVVEKRHRKEADDIEEGRRLRALADVPRRNRHATADGNTAGTGHPAPDEPPDGPTPSTAHPMSLPPQTSTTRGRTTHTGRAGHTGEAGDPHHTSAPT